MTDEQLGDLVVRFAVLESMTLHLAAYIVEGADKPGEAALALLSDLNEAFSSGSAPGVEEFEIAARSHIKRLEPRLLRLVRRDRDEAH